MFQIFTIEELNDKSELHFLQPMLDGIINNKVLEDYQKQLVSQMIKERSDCFSKNKNDLGYCPLIKHEIDVKSDIRPQQTYHRLPMGLEERVEKEIDELLEKGVIRESKSTWNSPIVVVRKPDSNDLRICLNYRKLNAVTNKPTYYIPDSNQLFDALEGAKFFNSIDLSNAYYQCEIEEDHKKYTAFNTRKGKFEFEKMPFGLCGAPFTFQKLMNEVLKEENWRSCVIYLDDVLIYSSSFEEHVKSVHRILTKVQDAGLKLSPKKCHFFCEKIKFLGHVVSRNGLQTDPAKIAKIQNWTLPATVSELRSFLGFCNYYRKFIEGYALLSSPLEGALVNLDKRKSENKINITWSEKMKDSFSRLKEKLCTPPVLAFPRRHCDFILDTDASFYGIGAVLSQIHDGEEKVIYYASRKLTKYEQSYCITRKELLAVYYFINYFRQYLLGRKFRIRTDHKALTWLMGWKQPKTTQYCHWISELEIYDFEVEHRKGREHVNADFLSRIDACEQCELQHANPKKKRNVKFECFPRANMIAFPEKQDQTLHDKNKIFRNFHDEMGHIGIAKMTKLVLRNHSWKNIRNDIKRYVNNCKACAQRKTAVVKNRPLLHITATKSFEKVMLDITGPLNCCKNGYRYILGIVDVYSRFVMLIPIRSIESNAVIKILETRWFPLFGSPDILVSDGASNLNSSLVKDLLNEYGVEKISTSPYHPQSNGIIERNFRTIKDMIFATVSSYGVDWVEALPFVEIGLRSAEHSTTNVSPYEIVFGRLPNLPQFIPGNLKFDTLNPDEYIKELERRRYVLRKRLEENIGKKFEQNGRKVVCNNLFREGDLVMVKCLPVKKIGVSGPRFEGPGEIVGIVDLKSYFVKMKGKVYRRHEDHLKKFKVSTGNLKNGKMQRSTIKRTGNLRPKRKCKRVDRYGFQNIRGE